MKMPNLWKKTKQTTKAQNHKGGYIRDKVQIWELWCAGEKSFKNNFGRLFSVLPSPLVLQQAQEQSAMKVNKLGSVAAQVVWRVVCLQS